MLLGQAWLHRELGLRVPEPKVQSRLGGVRATEHDGSRTILTFPRPYAVDNQPLAHLRFALAYEGIDLGVLNAVFSEIGPSPLKGWVRRQPTGAYSRRAWFFYETFVGRTLDVDNVRSGNYVEALSPSRHLVSSPRRSKRHRVLDNLLGGRDLCVTVRRTPELLRQLNESLDEEAKRVCANVDVAQLARALNYLYTKETRSSFAIEGETPSPNRAERFVAALRKAADFDACDKDALIELQKMIVEPRYAASDWRTTQNFVGETVSGYRERVHYIREGLNKTAFFAGLADDFVFEANRHGRRRNHAFGAWDVLGHGRPGRLFAALRGSRTDCARGVRRAHTGRR